MSALPAAFVVEVKAALGETAVVTSAPDMARFTISMRHRHERAAAMVVLPRTVEEVAAAVRLCRRHGVAYVPQGGNTGLVDGGLPREGKNEIIISLSRMNAIRAIDAVAQIATVEAGVVLQNLHDAAAEKGLMFPVSIASEGSAEIGGLIAANAGGLSALRYGCMRQQVLGVEAVLPNGEIVRNLNLLMKDNTGYHLASLLAGAEGTLGIITAANVRLLPALKQTATAIVGVHDIDAGLQLLRHFRAEAAEFLTAFEFMSQNAIALLLKNVAAARFPSMPQAAFYMLVELGASSAHVALREMMENLAAHALEQGIAVDVVLAETEAQAMQFWHAREHIPEALRAEKQRLHFDIALPLAGLGAFLASAGARIHAAYPNITLMPFGHIGDGNVHYNMYAAPLFAAEEFAAARPCLQDIVFAEVQAHGGSISAEHGVGVERKEILARIKPQAELDWMRAVKRALDPENLCNPGKIFD